MYWETSCSVKFLNLLHPEFNIAEPLGVQSVLTPWRRRRPVLGSVFGTDLLAPNRKFPELLAFGSFQITCLPIVAIMCSKAPPYRIINLLKGQEALA